ncbi:SpoIIE family protein phosphatase [Geomicrobium sp. JCM 19055]|uniref:SpoIIE family protein phosphatase n=1 Tax=Geomicrobium sp. JCM 19055 TaxID=1460649 RepID=UPI00045ED00F|nr:SpoIIE family protein phosphatase [Geomicrobium sp. JCM 19055]GAJ99559.1 phosphoserine phosphatase RsbX [Geomicrobium sp. JCM 19055]
MGKIIEEQYENAVTAAFQAGKGGNPVCGDMFITVETDRYFLTALADGLGSGKSARRSSELAMNVIEKHFDAPMEELFANVNQALAHERGVVLTVIRIDYERNQITCGNIGNVECLLMIDQKDVMRIIPTTGFLSGRSFKARVHHFSFKQNVGFLLHSDGVSKQMHRYELQASRLSPTAVVERLKEEMAIDKDDVTIVSGYVH